MMRAGSLLIAIVSLWLSSGCPAAAQAISATVAKSCNELVDKKFPPAVPGNPAAGLKGGTVQDARAYFRKCVDNNGKVDDAKPAK